MNTILATELHANSGGFKRDCYVTDKKFIQVIAPHIYLFPNQEKIPIGKTLTKISYRLNMETGVLNKDTFKYTKGSSAGNNNGIVIEKNSVEYNRIVRLIKRQKITVYQDTYEVGAYFDGTRISKDTTPPNPPKFEVVWNF